MKSGLFYPHIQESGKLLTRKLCHAYAVQKPCMCKYNKRMLITQDCTKFLGLIAWQIPCKQLCWFPGYSVGKKKIKISFSRWWCLELATSVDFVHALNQFYGWFYHDIMQTNHHLSLSMTKIHLLNDQDHIIQNQGVIFLYSFLTLYFVSNSWSIHMSHFFNWITSC